ncbi:glutaredoxin family protein [Paenibacillus alkalitolerans]|uniref:glutaredoxin family protein n=1 Tax=Paenibacillus alkalitolerans TaxID=2799335 RepID=UPI0018F3C199|nr:glutaredoxin domain-containing protein [Paenibacillus alkalitolerans]
MKIKVYWRKHCNTCEEVFQYLDHKQISYEKIDVTHDQARFDEMLRLGGIATPLIVVDGEVISYFEPKKMDRILEVT